MLFESADKSRWLIFWQLISEEAQRLDFLEADKTKQKDVPGETEADKPK